MGFNIDSLLASVYLRIINDTKDKDSLGVILNNNISVSKTARKPSNYNTYCFTIVLITPNKHDNLTLYNGTLIINFFAKDFDDGQARTSKLGEVGARLQEIFDHKPLIVEGNYMYNLRMTNAPVPLFDPDAEYEHFISLRFKYNMREDV